MKPIILCLASYAKGHDLLRECAAQGCPPILVTVENLKDADWPRDALAELHWLPDFNDIEAVINAISWLARSRRIGRIIALDEFDLQLAATLREHFRLAGPGETAARFFRDKLAMRQRAAKAGLAVPRFAGLFNDDDVRRFTDTVAPPWVLKPRTQAAAIGIQKIAGADALWPALEALEDRRSRFLIEEYVAGAVCHVDSLVANGKVLFACASRYSDPPFDVVHSGGLFSSTTVERGSQEEAALLMHNLAVAEGFGAVNCAMHTEFILSDADATYLFLETAARVGGAHIVDLVEAATGINLWREWARIEVARLRGQPYTVPASHKEYAGILISLARQEVPDLSAYDDPEIVWRLNHANHAGLIVASPDVDRVSQLIADYMPRFRHDFFASLPAPDKPTH